jgi:hypothetical protein
MRYTWGIHGLFPLAVALIDEAVGFLSNVLFLEVRVVGKDGFQAVVEHDRGGRKITVALLNPFGCPDGTDDMGVPVLASVAIDKMFCDPT